MEITSMGSSQSVATPTEKMTSQAEQRDDDAVGGLMLSDRSVSPEILYHILSFVPKEDLIRNCLVVCKFWKSLLDTQAVWKLKCIREGIPFPSRVDELPQHFYRRLCFKNPFGRNLISNPCGDDQLRHWIIKASGGDGWKVETPPVGVDPVTEIPELKDVKSCFATSYGACIKCQLVNLIKEGCSAEILDTLQPEVIISDWYAARFDCASRYHLKVFLLDKDKEKLSSSFSVGPIDEEQWVGRKWHKVEHSFVDYGPGLRYVYFQQLGHDNQFWAGHYGSKMTASTVRLNVD